MIKILLLGWAHDPRQRPIISDIYQELDGLFGSNDMTISPSKDLNNNSFTTFDNLKFEPILSVKEGIHAHNIGEREKAWKCFEIHATLGDPVAMYWKSIYCFEGFVIESDENEAFKY